MFTYADPILKHVKCGLYNVPIKQLPFGNTFTASKIRLINNEVVLYAKCTKASKEPGRVYKCYYTLNGELLECFTVN